jgi:molybdopterin/thiamine biosynthesis adenylyltransferase
MISEAEVLQFLVANFGQVAKVDISVFKKRRLKYCFSLVDKIEGIEVTIFLGLDEEFPLSLPSYFISITFPFIPHVEEDGKICYTHDDNVFVDYTDPYSVITESFQLARNTITAGIRGENKVDFINEFESYWLRLKDVEQIYGNLNLSSGPSQIKIGLKNKLTFAVSEESEYLEKTKRFIDLTDKGITYENGIYFSLEPEFYPDPPRSNDPITFEYFKRILSGVKANDLKIVQKLANRPTKAKEYVIISFEQPDGIKSIFAFQFSGSKKHPIVANDFSGKIKPVSIQRLDKEYLIKRGGNGETHFNKKGLIIGCGSVGGFIIEELIRTGFTDLHIVDNDKLSQENSYRHFVGFEHLYQPKVDAIKKRIEKIFPHSNITAINDKIERLILNKKLDFSSYQFIVVATGNVTVNHFLNELIISKFPGLPIFFSWNEPYGIGGHVLSANINNSGCYNCLYDNQYRHNRASFADRNQSKPFLKSVSGCGTIYTPFSSIDSRYTACLTVKKVVGVMNGSQNTNTINSWKGDDKLFTQEGFRSSARYKFDERQLLEAATKFESPTCPTCKNAKAKMP